MKVRIKLDCSEYPCFDFFCAVGRDKSCHLLVDSLAVKVPSQLRYCTLTKPVDVLLVGRSLLGLGNDAFLSVIFENIKASLKVLAFLHLDDSHIFL